MRERGEETWGGGAAHWQMGGVCAWMKATPAATPVPRRTRSSQLRLASVDTSSRSSKLPVPSSTDGSRMRERGASVHRREWQSKWMCKREQRALMIITGRSTTP